MTRPVSQLPRLRRTYRGEEAWFPLLDEVGHRALRAGFIASGVSPTMAGNLVWFLDEQSTLERHLADESRVRYRRALADLEVEEIAVLARRAIGPRQFNSASARAA